MATVKLPYELQGGQKAIASQVMANFEAVISGFNAINKELETVTAEVDEFNKKPTLPAFTIFPSLVGKAPTGAYPLWTGEQVINARTLFKDFWEKALEYAKAGYIRTLTQAEYDAEVEEYGQTGAFVLDELNGHIRLPKIIRFIGALEDIVKLGVPQKDGIPELKGEFFIAGNAVQGAEASGIFKKKGGRNCTGYGMGAASMPSIEIDLSGQVNITDEVQPRHVQAAWYIQVANNVTEISSLDTAAIAEQLDNALGEIAEKQAEAEASYTALALEKTNEIGSTVNDLILGIQEEAAVEVKRVADEGDKQVARVIEAGSDLVETGADQVAAVTAEGDVQTARVAETGSDLVSVGAAQTALVASEGAKQVGLVEQSGASLVESGDAQVARVTAEGNVQVARIIETVESEVDDKLEIIQESAQQIYDAGTTQLEAVNEAGTTQVAAVNSAGAAQTANAAAEADRAAALAMQAAASADDAVQAALGVNNGWNLFDCKWADHLEDDMSWLRADTFSWQSGDTYSSAYNELLSERQKVTATKSDTIAGVTVTYYQTPKGYKIALANQETAIASLYNSTGAAWYYILDADNGRFKLPRTKWGFVGFRDVAGSYVAESLPNITGKFDSTELTNNTEQKNSGALYGTNSSLGVIATGAGGQSLAINFDASRSSQTYKNNAPVQQRATQMYLYFYVGNFSTEAVRQTAGLNAELFNGKADIDLENVVFSQAFKNKIINLTSVNYAAEVTRSHSTQYTSTGGAIYGEFQIDSNGSTLSKLYINGKLVADGKCTAILNAGAPFFFLVPNGVTYKLDQAGTLFFAPYK